MAAQRHVDAAGRRSARLAIAAHGWRFSSADAESAVWMSSRSSRAAQAATNRATAELAVIGRAVEHEKRALLASTRRAATLSSIVAKGRLSALKWQLPVKLTTVSGLTVTLTVDERSLADAAKAAKKAKKAEATPAASFLLCSTSAEELEEALWSRISKQNAIKECEHALRGLRASTALASDDAEAASCAASCRSDEWELVEKQQVA